jgi:hypothetical protein
MEDEELYNKKKQRKQANNQVISSKRQRDSKERVTEIGFRCKFSEDKNFFAKVFNFRSE